MMTLTFEGMSRSYGGVSALSDVTLTLTGGRVHALMGENGAGKSTLIKLIAGVVDADRMSVRRDGSVVPLAGPQDADAAGFRFIHQELNIVPQVSVAENVLLGRRYPRRWGLAVDWRALRRTAREALAFLGATHIDVAALAGSLPAGDRMLVKIAAALVAEDGAETTLYVLDEPTAALTGEESELLFAVIRRLKRHGAAILYVSHRIDEVLRICDDVTVLRDGRRVSTGPVAATSKAAIIQAMTGRDMRDAYPPRTSPVADRTVVSVRGVRTRTLRDLCFDLREGEILGVSGLAEAGQSEVLRMFLGLEPVLGGETRFDGGALPDRPRWHGRAGSPTSPASGGARR